MTAPSPDAVRPLGATGLTVTALTVGTSALGNPERVSEQEAQSTLGWALSGQWTIDTGNNYGSSEERIGRALRTSAGPPPVAPSAGRLIATKVDPVKSSTDFSGARVRQSVRESMARLGVDHLDLVSLHDPERIPFADAMADDGPVRALLSLRDDGVIGHLGVAGGPVGLLERFVSTGHFEVVVTHNRFTLIDRSAGTLLDMCTQRRIGVFNAAPFGGGFLTARTVDPTSSAGQHYCYRPATPAQLQTRQAMARACQAHEVDLASAALQFSTRDPRISSTIVGMSSRAQLEQTLQRSTTPIEADLWRELEELALLPTGWIGRED